MVKLVWTELSTEDLKEIFDYILRVYHSARLLKAERLE